MVAVEFYDFGKKLLLIDLNFSASCCSSAGSLSCQTCASLCLCGCRFSCRLWVLDPTHVGAGAQQAVDHGADLQEQVDDEWRRRPWVWAGELPPNQLSKEGWWKTRLLSTCTNTAQILCGSIVTFIVLACLWFEAHSRVWAGEDGARVGPDHWPGADCNVGNGPGPRAHPAGWNRHNLLTDMVFSYWLTGQEIVKMLIVLLLMT